MASLGALPPPEERGPPGKVRRFSDGFLLTVFTLGIYPLVWHHRVHAELMRHLGRPNRLRSVWVAHILLIVGMFVFALAFVLPLALEQGGFVQEGISASAQVETVRPTDVPVRGSGSEDAAFVLMLKEAGLYAPYLFLLVGINLTFAGYVVGQYMWLYTVRGDGARAGIGGAALFLVLIWAGVLFERMSPPLLIRLLLLLFPVAAYYHLQAGYNEYWTDTVGIQEPAPDSSSGFRGIVEASVGCDQCGAMVAGAGSAGAELIVACRSCGWRNTLRLPEGSVQDKMPPPAHPV